MQKQFIINVDTSQTPAVQAFETSGAPVTTPPISSTCQPVASYDGAYTVTDEVGDRINEQILEALRGVPVTA